MRQDRADIRDFFEAAAAEAQDEGAEGLLLGIRERLDQFAGQQDQCTAVSCLMVCEQAAERVSADGRFVLQLKHEISRTMLMRIGRRSAVLPVYAEESLVLKELLTRERMYAAALLRHMEPEEELV